MHTLWNWKHTAETSTHLLFGRYTLETYMTNMKYIRMVRMYTEHTHWMVKYGCLYRIKGRVQTSDAPVHF